MAILSQFVALLTFPGVVMHQAVEQLFCRWARVAVVNVCYFQLGNPAGYVVHEPGLNLSKSLLIGLGPFFVNSLLGALVAFPAALTALEFRVATLPGYVVAWLGISIATQAIPNTGSTTFLWDAVWSRQRSWLTRLLAAPIAGSMFLLSAGRYIGLDLVYGVAIVAAPPFLLLHFLR